MAAKFLHEMAADDDTLSILEIDILSHPLQTWQAGIRMIPAIRIEKRTLSGLYLTRKKIIHFVYNEEA